MKDIKYQQDTLAALRQYLSLARTSAPKTAFEVATAGLPAALRREYIALSDAVADARMSASASPPAAARPSSPRSASPLPARSFSTRTSLSLLWLVPTKTIRDQTIKALQTPGNMHHDALEDRFKGRFRVLAVTDFDQLRPHDLGARTTSSVGTLATRPR